MAIEDKLKKINTLQREISKLSPPLPDWDSEFMEKVKVDFTYASNKLEGNKVTYGQTIQILKDLVTPRETSISDYLDIVNHKNVLDLVFEDFQSQRISEPSIKKLHRELMKNPAQWSDEIYYDPGKYKLFENLTYRSNGKMHNYASPQQVAPAMAELIRATNQSLENVDIKSTTLHPLAIANAFHLAFLNQIHPFGDGNGRLARIIMNIILLQNGLPPIFIKEVNKADYLNSFSAEEDHPGAMLEFMADRLIESLREKRKFLKKLMGSQLKL